MVNFLNKIDRLTSLSTVMLSIDGVRLILSDMVGVARDVIFLKKVDLNSRLFKISLINSKRSDITKLYGVYQ